MGVILHAALPSLLIPFGTQLAFFPMALSRIVILFKQLLRSCLLLSLRARLVCLL
jgi:hypothetical protein